MWQKKTSEGVAGEEPSLALHPVAARTAAGVAPYGAFEMEGPRDASPQRHRRGGRLPWFLGLILLAGTAVGAAWALNHGAGEPSDTAANASSPPPGVVALGMVDNEPGIRKLRAPLPGKVIEVAAEGRLFKKGELLLRLDNRAATLLLEEAEAALDNARKQLELAEVLPKKHELEVQSQEKAITAAEKKAEAVRQDLEANRELRKGKDPIISKGVLDAAEANFKAVEALVEIQKIRLREIKLARPDIEVARAQSDVAAKKAQRKKAKLALEHCDLLAPENGVILRTFVNPGEWIAPDARVPAMEFCPSGKRVVRAEVLQEWASLIEKGQKVVIEDDTRAGPKWEGSVARVSDWITHKRDIMLEPFMVNDVRTLECLIDVVPGGPPLRIGQRVRVTIQQSK
jgi:HlyD family secretion protein